jgi:GntR family transcriptional regulator/MocR family aminotransferase
MTKIASIFDLSLRDRRSSDKLWRWLYDEIRTAILSGRLNRGSRLPATRELARQYGVSRGTVVMAFEQLHSEGYLEGRTGDGTYVNASVPEDLLTVRPITAGARSAGHRPVLSRLAGRLPPAPDASNIGPARPFSPVPSPDEFPIATWAQIAARCLRRATRRLLADADSRGYRPLREAIAEYVGEARGVKCTADHVIIVSGIQHGLDLTIRLLLDPNDAVCLEDPCFPIVASMFNTAMAKIVPVPVDDQGFDSLEAKRRCHGPKLIYVTPGRQFPLGSMMPVSRRLSLLEWSAQVGALIFEDDYDSEYRYAGRPIPALQGFDERGVVIYSGSFSKVLLPSLRLGYLIVPSALVDTFAAVRFLTDRHASVLEQAAMCEFITAGHFGRHIRRTRELYGGRLAALRDALQSRLAGVIDLPESDAGTHIPAWLGQKLRAAPIAAAAAAKNIEAVPIRRFVLQTPRPEGFLFGFAPYSPRQIRESVDALAAVIEASFRRTGSTKRNLGTPSSKGQPFTPRAQ